MEGDRCSKTTRQHLTSGGELRDAGAPTALRAASYAYRASDVTDAPELTRRLDPVSFEVIAGHDRGDTKQARQALSIMAAMMLIAELTPIPAEAEIMKIRITLNGKAITATLSDNATSRDFVSMLPINLTLEDYGETEKIGYLPRKLSTDGAPAGSNPSTGDVAYYAPWGNVAIFRRNFRYSIGLVKLGKIDSGLEVLDDVEFGERENRDY